MTPSCIIAAAQFSPDIDDAAANLAVHQRLLERAAALGVGFLVFPELSMTGYDHARSSAQATDADDTRLAPLSGFARDHGMTIAVGLPLRTSARPKIAAAVFAPDAPAMVYEKQHLHTGEDDWFDPGAGGGLSEIAGRRIAHAICADISQPSHAAAAAARGADVYAAGVLVTPGGYDEDAALLQGYARNLDMAVLLANYHGRSGPWACAGRSAFWDQQGRLLAQAPVAADALVVATGNVDGWTAAVHTM